MARGCLVDAWGRRMDLNLSVEHIRLQETFLELQEVFFEEMTTFFVAKPSNG